MAFPGGAAPDWIPWLLLTAIDHQGDGAFRNISSIQRLQTKGGKPPASGCDAAHKGQESRSHYTAVYYFYIRRQLLRACGS
jgi:hypothetical protein